MPAARVIFRVLVVTISCCFLVGCDDDDDVNKTPKYDTTIFISDHIDIEANGNTIIRRKPEGRFKKPRIEVHTPGGVEVEHWTRPKRKGTIYDYDLIDYQTAISIIIIAFLGVYFLQRHRFRLLSSA